MHYMVLTANTATRRDSVADYLDACRAEGLMAGLYFSVKEWNIPRLFS